MIYVADRVADARLLVQIESDNAERRERAIELRQRWQAQAATPSIEMQSLMQMVADNRQLIIALGNTVESYMRQQRAAF